MYLWRRSASQRWLTTNEMGLRALTADQLAIIQRANRKQLQLEVAAKSRSELQTIKDQFGGRITKLPPDWLKRALQTKTRPIRVGNAQLIIPPEAAFGTGEHATTAMSLRLLEKLTGNWKRGWSIVDLGTGSGILALAAKILGANRVIGIDNDSVAISIAKRNARRNKIRGAEFVVRDVRKWKSTRVDVVTANLFSELLVEILPKIRNARWLILSGFLRGQERALRCSLARENIEIIGVRRSGKWVAMVGRRR